MKTEYHIKYSYLGKEKYILVESYSSLKKAYKRYKELCELNYLSKFKLIECGITERILYET